MLDCVETFFNSWQIEESESRLAKIKSSVTNSIQYSDPRAPETIIGIDALNSYVGMFRANAPGWSAKVVKNDTIANVTRVTVEFSGAGPDGSYKVQLGQYFLEKEGDLLSRIVGFVGTGE